MDHGESVAAGSSLSETGFCPRTYDTNPTYTYEHARPFESGLGQCSFFFDIRSKKVRVMKAQYNEKSYPFEGFINETLGLAVLVIDNP